MPPSMTSMAQLWHLCLVCMMRCVTKPMPIQFIDSNKLKSCRMGLTNHTWPMLHHITPLFINAFEGRHTDVHTYRHVNKNDFKKPGERGHRPGLMIFFLENNSVFPTHAWYTCYMYTHIIVGGILRSVVVIIQCGHVVYDLWVFSNKLQ